MSEDKSSAAILQIGVGEALKRYRLRLPAYQREYAWGAEKEVKALLDDFTFAILRNENQYFLGAMSTIQGKQGTIEVVDGQQRLATTALIFAAMREIVGSEHDALKTLLSSFLSSIDGYTLEESPNLVLNTLDSSVFHSLITTGNQGEGFVENRQSHVRLVDAYGYIKKHLKKLMEPLPASRKWSVFQTWVQFLQSKAIVIWIINSSAANAYKMFETMNYRGQEVSQSDLIKNYIFGETQNSQDQAKQHWNSMRSALEALDGKEVVLNFIRHAMIATDGFIQQKRIFEKVEKEKSGEQTGITLLATWDAMAADYVALSNPDSSNWSGYPKKLRENIRVLNLFAIAPLKPLLLAMVKRFDPKETALGFEKAVSIGVRLIVASRTTTMSVEKPIGDTSAKIWRGEVTSVKQMLKELSNAIPNNRQFQDAFETATVSKQVLARYYLRSLERVAKQEPEPWLIPNDDSNQITLEHILPMKPDPVWDNSSDGFSGWNEEDVRTYVKRIGNMALLTSSANSLLRSSGFSDKRPVFQASPYVTTSMVAKDNFWTPETIIQRQKILAEYAVKAWPL